MQKVIKSNILLPLLEDSYRAEYTEWDRKNLRFSDAGIAAPQGQKCERQVYYDVHMSKEKSLLTTGSLVLFDDGRLHEQDIRRRLRTILRSPEREVNDPKTGARGKLDNTIFHHAIKELPWRPAKDLDINQDIKEDPGLEIKSVNQFAYQEMAKTGQIEQSYYDQIQLYLLFEPQCSFFICLIKNRNSLGDEKGKFPFLEFIVFPDTDRQIELYAGFVITKQALDQKILPPRPFLRDSTQCQFCRFKHICWEPLKAHEEIIERLKEGQIPPMVSVIAAMKVYNESKKQLVDLKRSQDEAREILIQYFKASGKNEVDFETLKATYAPRTAKVWNLNVLQERLNKEELLAISDPSEEKLKTLIAEHKIDASILDEAITKQPAGYALSVTEAKPDGSVRQSVPELKGEKNGRGKKPARKKLTPGTPDRKPRKGSRVAKQRKD